MISCRFPQLEIFTFNDIKVYRYRGCFFTHARYWRFFSTTSFWKSWRVIRIHDQLEELLLADNMTYSDLCFLFGQICQYEGVFNYVKRKKISFVFFDNCFNALSFKERWIYNTFIRYCKNSLTVEFSAKEVSIVLWILHYLLFSLKRQAKVPCRTIYNSKELEFSIELLFNNLKPDNVLIFFFTDDIEENADEVLYPLDNETYGHENLKREQAWSLRRRF